jgi:hypothetical protein
MNQTPCWLTTERAVAAYRQVADLVQRGLTEHARQLAVLIPVDHLRGRALLLVNYSRRL